MAKRKTNVAKRKAPNYTLQRAMFNAPYTIYERLEAAVNLLNGTNGKYAE